MTVPIDNKKLWLLSIIIVLVATYFVFDLGQYLSLEFLRDQLTAIQAGYHAHPWVTIAAFFLLYVVVTGLSVPGATVLTLAAGALFGLVVGTLVVSFASTLGATLAFLSARIIFRDTVQSRFGQRLKAINHGVRKDGAFYLFGLRLVPVFPFFVVNLAMGLTPIRTWTFAWVSQLGMLAGTIVYVNAGTQLADLESVSGLLSFQILASFALLAVFPFLARKVLRMVQTRRLLRGWDRPRRFDCDLVVIGGGSAGLVSAYIGATVKAKVTLVEEHRMGGDCLNTGCVPSKALLRSARFLAQMQHSRDFGVRSATAEFDFAEVMQRVQRVVEQIEPHDSIERYQALGVAVRQGRARIRSPYTVTVDGQTLTTRNIIVATGARPSVPAIPGLEQTDYLTTETIWALRTLPQRLIVLGGGPVGCELAQAFARFGSRVTQVEMTPRLLPQEDADISDRLMARLRAEGVDLRTTTRAKAVRVEGARQSLICERDGREETIEFDRILVAVGRAPNTAGFGLEELGVELTKTDAIDVDSYLRTRIPNVYAAGDVVGPYQFTHMAAHQAWYATVNALFGSLRQFRVDYAVVPWTTFTDPEVARVGLNEQQAQEQAIDYEVTSYRLDDLDRAITDEVADGVVKVLTQRGKDRVLGATIVGEHAGDLIAEYVTAMRHKIGLNRILGTIHVYPTLAEANKFAAGEWKRAHAPQRILALVERWHAWRRGDRANHDSQATNSADGGR